MLKTLFRTFRSHFFSIFLIGIIVITIYSEYFLGIYFSTAISATLTTILLILSLLKNKALSVPKIPILIFLIYTLWVALITPLSLNITQSMWEIVHTVMLLFLLLVSYYIGKEKHYTFFLTSLFSISLLVVGFDMFSYIFSRDFGSVSLTGIFSWHNQMAGFILFIIPVGLSILLITKKRLHKITIYLGLFLLMSAIILTTSRGGWIIVTLEIILFILLTTKTIKLTLLKMFLFSIGIFFAIFLIKPDTIQSTIASIPQELTANRTVSGNFRISTWSSTLSMISKHPFTGVGPGAFGSVFATFQNQPWLFAQNAHNHILQIAAETGLFGGIVFCIFLLYTFFRVVPKIKRRPKTSEKIYLLGLTLAISALFLHSLIDYDLSMIALSSLFFIFLGLIFGIIDKNPYEFKITKQTFLLYPYLLFFLIFVLILELSEDRYITAKHLLEDGYKVQAYDSVEMSLSLNPYSAKGYFLAADILYRDGQKDYAQWFAKRAISQTPYENTPYSLLGAIAAENNQYSEAIKWYNKGINVKPYASPNQYTGLAYSFYQSGDITKAEEILDHAVSDIFPLNQTYKEFQYVYYANGLTNDLAALYVFLARIKNELGKEEEANNLLLKIKNELTPPENTLKIQQIDMLE